MGRGSFCGIGLFVLDGFLRGLMGLFFVTCGGSFNETGLFIFLADCRVGLCVCVWGVFLWDMALCFGWLLAGSVFIFWGNSFFVICGGSFYEIGTGH